MKTIAQYLLRAAEVALLILALLTLFVPELRVVPVKIALRLSWWAVAAPKLWRDYKAGVFKMTPRQIYQRDVRQKTSLLTGLAIMVGGVAMIITLP